MITCGKRGKNLWKHIGLQSRVQSNIQKRKSRIGSILTSYVRKVRPTSHNRENIPESKSMWEMVQSGDNGHFNIKSVGKAKQDAIESIYTMIS